MDFAERLAKALEVLPTPSLGRPYYGRRSSEVAAACQGKVEYDTKIGALKALSGVRLHRKTGTLHAFLCPHCHKYHLGNSTRKN